MSDPARELNSSMSRTAIEAEGLANDPVYASIQRVLNREEVARADLEPQVLPRGATASARRELVEAIARKLGVEQEYEAWMRVRDDQAEQVLAMISDRRSESPEESADYFRGLGEPPARTRSVAEMWWARSDAGAPAGMNVEFRSDGLHMFGQLNRNDGDLWQGSLRATATFVLDPSRMPPGGPGRFSSAPHCELFGQIAGITGNHGGDNWSKCWLHTAQFVHGGPGGGRIGEGHDHRNLFFLAQDFELASPNLPGFMLFPRVDFQLDPGHDLVIILEVRFDFQLEGIAAIWFGSQTVGHPPLHRDALLRTFQWFIQRL